MRVRDSHHFNKLIIHFLHLKQKDEILLFPRLATLVTSEDLFIEIGFDVIF